MPGEKLQGKVIVTANGNQRFPVEVTLAVNGSAVQTVGSWDPVPGPVDLPKLSLDPPPVRRGPAGQPP